jgi:hypothetical protein
MGYSLADNAIKAKSRVINKPSGQLRFSACPVHNLGEILPARAAKKAGIPAVEESRAVGFNSS